MHLINRRPAVADPRERLNSRISILVLGTVNGRMRGGIGGPRAIEATIFQSRGEFRSNAMCNMRDISAACTPARALDYVRDPVVHSPVTSLSLAPSRSFSRRLPFSLVLRRYSTMLLLGP